VRAWSIEICSAIVPNRMIMVCYIRVIFKASCSCNYAIRAHIFLSIVNEHRNFSEEWLLIPTKLRINKDLICTSPALSVTILRRAVLTAVLYRLQNNLKSEQIDLQNIHDMALPKTLHVITKYDSFTAGTSKCQGSYASETTADIAFNFEFLGTKRGRKEVKQLLNWMWL
jgi:hypothetical protein